MKRQALSKLAALSISLPILTACQTSTGTYENALNDATGKESPPAVAVPVHLGMDSERDSSSVSAKDLLNQFSTENMKPQQRPTDQGGLEAGLWMQVEQLEKATRTSGSRVMDPTVNAYITEIICRVAQSYCSDFRAYIMHVPAFNASMAPNGMMIVWSGLLLRADNEAQVAAVLGHEIGHYVRRHSMQRHKDMVERSNGLAFFGIMTSAAGFGSLSDFAGLLSQMGMFAFSRENEREADGWGSVLLNQAGYDAREAATIWGNILEESKFRGIERQDDAFSSHPPSEERQAALIALAERIERELDPVGRELGKQRYLDTMWVLRRTFLQDEIQIGNYRSVHFLLNRMEKNGDDLRAVHFMRGEAIRLGGLKPFHGKDSAEWKEAENLSEADRERASFELALKSYQAAESVDAAALPDDQRATALRPMPAELYRSMGITQRRLGDPSGAAASLARYLTEAPDAKDRPVITLMIEELSGS